MTLTDWALHLRQVASILSLVCAAQFAWRATSDVASYYENTAQPVATSTAVGALPEREDLRKLEEMLRKEKETGLAADEEAAPQPRQRRLLVDLGPPRSKVYVNGILMGSTPYAGQVSCLDGDVIRIQVLPPEGAPHTSELECHGAQLLAGAQAAGSSAAKVDQDYISKMEGDIR